MLLSASLCAAGFGRPGRRLSLSDRVLAHPARFHPLDTFFLQRVGGRRSTLRRCHRSLVSPRPSGRARAVPCVAVVLVGAPRCALRPRRAPRRSRRWPPRSLRISRPPRSRRRRLPFRSRRSPAIPLNSPAPAPLSVATSAVCRCPPACLQAGVARRLQCLGEAADAALQRSRELGQLRASNIGPVHLAHAERHYAHAPGEVRRGKRRSQLHAESSRGSVLADCGGQHGAEHRRRARVDPRVGHRPGRRRRKAPVRLGGDRPLAHGCAHAACRCVHQQEHHRRCRLRIFCLGLAGWRWLRRRLLPGRALRLPPCGASLLHPVRLAAGVALAVERRARPVRVWLPLVDFQVAPGCPERPVPAGGFCLRCAQLAQLGFSVAALGGEDAADVVFQCVEQVR